VASSRSWRRSSSACAFVIVGRRQREPRPRGICLLPPRHGHVLKIAAGRTIDRVRSRRAPGLGRAGRTGRFTREFCGSQAGLGRPGRAPRPRRRDVAGTTVAGVTTASTTTARSGWSTTMGWSSAWSPARWRSPTPDAGLLHC
jgi:hypothetical protein